MDPSREHSGGDRRPAGRGGASLLRPEGRWRLAVLASLAFCLYSCACSFWLYLSTGDWLRLRLASYAADFTNPVTLPDLFERTLNVLTHPWMIAVGGMVLGVVIFAPIIAAVLYRLAAALPLTAAVLVVGHAPAMALALVCGCLIAGLTRLRRTAPFLAAVTGVLPLVVYLYLFSSAGSGAAAVLPIQRWALKAPYLVAVASAVLSFAVVLGLARLARYRPGVVWPVVAVMLAAPAGLFVWKIGPSELEYQLIAARLAGGDAIFEPADREAWIKAYHEQGLSPQALARRAADVLEKRKAELEQDCLRFLRRYGASTRAPAIMWVLAQCDGLQLDRPAFEQGWIKSTAAHVAPVPGEEQQPQEKTPQLRRDAIASATGVWETLRVNYPGSPQAALASWRLAELDLRGMALPDVSPEDANRLLLQAVQLLRGSRSAITACLGDWGPPRPGASDDVFVAAPPLPAPEYYERALHNASRLLWLMERNGAPASRRSAEALGAMLEVNGLGLSHAACQRELAALAGKYEDTPVAMNLKLAVALEETDAQRRADQLVLLASERRDEDAAIEASYELGLLLLQDPALRRRSDVKDPSEYFMFVRDAAQNPWQARAEERLAVLKARSASSAPAGK